MRVTGMNRKGFCISLLTGISAVLLSNIGYAQEDAEAAPQVAGVLEEVTVTARKREESLQDVPISISAFDENFINSSFAQEMQDFDKYAPNVELGRMQFGGSAMTASIRGVSFSDLERSYEPAVGMSVDGVFMANNTGAMIDIIDLASIEILRGPQGTLYGRNTIGGTINVTRTKPTGEFGGKLAAEYGSYNRFDVKGMINFPLIEDTLAMKVAGYVLQGDSHTRTIQTGERDDGIDKVAATVSLLWTPSENFEAQFTYDYLDDESTYPGLVNLTENGGIPGYGLVCLLGECSDASWGVSLENGFKTSYTETPFQALLRQDTLNLTMIWDTDNYTIKSITGYSDGDDTLDAEVTGANDGSILGAPGVYGPAIYFNRAQTFSQISQEFNMASNFDGPFNFVAGLYYLDSEYDMVSHAEFGVVVPIDANSGQDLKAKAIFAEITYDITDAWRLIVGGRYTDEKKRLYRDHISNGWSCPDPDSEIESCRNPEDSWDDFTPRAILDYSFSDDIMGYVSYSTGFRSGGWDARASQPSNIGPYDPETVASWETGIRTMFANNRVRLNAAIFTTEYKDKQEEVIDADGLTTNTQISNAAKATINGLEVELDALVTDALHIRAALGLLDSKYDSFDEFNPDTGEFDDVRAERNFRYAPDYSFTLGGDYTINLESGQLVFGANVKATDKFTSSPKIDPLGLNRDIIDDYTQLDLSVTYDRPMRNGNLLSVAVWGNDVTHSDGRLFRTLDATNYWFGSQEPGRTWGANVTWGF
jgi:iron complex outermembrane receptor protein